MTLSLPQHYREILKDLGEDPEREGLLDTPKRAAKAMQYLCHGYGQSLEDLVNGALFASDSDEMVIVADIELYSLCEHHLLPFIGKAHVAWPTTVRLRRKKSSVNPPTPLSDSWVIWRNRNWFTATT